ncbi:hypothetical protein PJ985_15165 [Streptomyces sp. ACA25]|uniref:PH-like domain-containing protein n=1 Tax=Streptomyces sp. ACA25 TaxID=3022596 RepID=UPI0023076086|nr:hypothetical protein [Streptomyces sp. ACA25]MDB1088907.1 hypothetical protein [Streptomyces sp. ACA25]
MKTVLTGLLADGTIERKSQEVTDWGARIAWTLATLLFIALLYWLMRKGWQRRGALQKGLPELPAAPAAPGEPRLRMTGRYHGSTTAGAWLDRIVVHGLGTRSRAELSLTGQGVQVLRPGAADFFIPAGRLRGARLDKGIAGKVVTEGGLLVITWQHGDRLLDSGFRSDRTAEHAAWVRVLNDTAGAGTADTDISNGTDAAAAATHLQEGAR